MKTVVVTGVSTGIGHATARVLLDKGFKVFGSVRANEDAVRLKRELGVHFYPLIFDITDAAAVTEAANAVQHMLAGKTLYGLVNNAGIAVPGPLLHIRIDDFRRQIDVNLTGQLIAVQAFAPLLDGEVPGRIVMISSVSGKSASPFVGPYAASKFGLEGLSESLRRELLVYGIDVIVIAPGPIATPIWDKVRAVDVTQFSDTPYADALEKAKGHMTAIGKKGLLPDKIATAVWQALTVPHPKARYTITPTPLTYYAMRLMPKRWADRLYAKALGLNRVA